MTNIKKKMRNAKGAVGRWNLLSRKMIAHNEKERWFLQEKQVRDWEMTSGSPYYPSNKKGVGSIIFTFWFISDHVYAWHFK